MTSLKTQLFLAIKQAYPNPLSYDAAEIIAKGMNHKTETATRKLRELCAGEYPAVAPMKNSKGAIAAYLYRPLNDLSPEKKPTQNQLFKNKLRHFN